VGKRELGGEDSGIVGSGVKLDMSGSALFVWREADSDIADQTSGFEIMPRYQG